MTVYVTKDGRQLGPYPIEQLRELVRQGQFSETDLAWHEGAPNWIPLLQVLRSFAPGPPSPSQHPGLGIASFVIGLITGPCWLVLLFVAGTAYKAGATEQSAIMIAVGLIIFAGFGLNLLGGILGIVALQKPNAKKPLSIVGVTLNALQVMGMIGLIILGLTIKS